MHVFRPCLCRGTTRVRRQSTPGQKWWHMYRGCHTQHGASFIFLGASLKLDSRSVAARQCVFCKLLGAADQAGQPGSIQPARIPVPLQCLHLTCPCKDTQRLSSRGQVCNDRGQACTITAPSGGRSNLQAGNLGCLCQSLGNHMAVQASMVPSTGCLGLGVPLSQHAAFATFNVASAHVCISQTACICAAHLSIADGALLAPSGNAAEALLPNHHGSCSRERNCSLQPSCELAMLPQCSSQAIKASAATAASCLPQQCTENGVCCR